MKRPRSFRLERAPREGSTPREKVLFWGWNWLLLILMAVLLGIGCLMLAPGDGNWDIFGSYFSHPGILALNLLPPVVLSALLYGLIGRAWIAHLITCVPMLTLAVGNFYKIAFRDDPVVAADLRILVEAGKMAGNYDVYLSGLVVLALLAGILGAVILFFFARGTPRRWWSRLAIALCAAVLAAALTPTYLSDEAYEANRNTEHIDQWVATQQFISRGLIYPFIYSIKDALPDPPEGYSKAEVEQLLDRYDTADIPEDKKVNVVAIMLEAFADFSSYEQIELQQDVYRVWHALEAEGYSGDLITNIFAGGTINTERAFLTGISYGDHNYRNYTSSFVWYLREQGYLATGDHPSNDWFYNRKNINEYVGFERYRFIENYYNLFTENNSVNDNLFLPELTASVLEQMQGDQPLFSFSVTYQGHGPYSDQQCWWGGVDDFVGNHDLDQGYRTVLANYFGSVQNTLANLETMVEQFRSSDEPIVLVLFGDHKPWLGNNSAIYTALGIEMNMNSEQAFYNYWSTPYLFWANDAAKQALGTELSGEGPKVSPCFLMELLFEQCGWEGDAYMQALRAIRKEYSVIHTNKCYVNAQGRLTAWLDDTEKQKIQTFYALEYYRANHFVQ